MYNFIVHTLDSFHEAVFIYYVIFTQEYPISVQHCSPWGSCITYMTIQTSISIHSVLIYSDYMVGLHVHVDYLQLYMFLIKHNDGDMAMV